MKITVTQEHINTGKRGSARSCPVALALIKAGLANVSVGPRSFSANRKRFFWSTPKAVEGCFPNNIYEWIKDFDYNRDVKPITFEV